MKLDTVKDILTAIQPDPREEQARQDAHRQWASIAKPLDSLGLLETAVEGIAVLTLSEKIDISSRAGMRLGEGTGAVAAIPLLDMALALYSDGTTFDGTGIEAYTPQGR